MRRLLVICAIATLALMAAPLASACSDAQYARFVQTVNNKALYATDLLQSGLYSDGAAALASA
jgi:hypothetical protein